MLDFSGKFKVFQEQIKKIEDTPISESYNLHTKTKDLFKTLLIFLTAAGPNAISVDKDASNAVKSVYARATEYKKAIVGTIEIQSELVITRLVQMIERKTTSSTPAPPELPVPPDSNTTPAVAAASKVSPPPATAEAIVATADSKRTSPADTAAIEEKLAPSSIVVIGTDSTSLAAVEDTKKDSEKSADKKETSKLKPKKGKKKAAAASDDDSSESTSSSDSEHSSDSDSIKPKAPVAKHKAAATKPAKSKVKKAKKDEADTPHDDDAAVSKKANTKKRPHDSDDDRAASKKAKKAKKGKLLTARKTAHETNAEITHKTTHKRKHAASEPADSAASDSDDAPTLKKKRSIAAKAKLVAKSKSAGDSKREKKSAAAAGSDSDSDEGSDSEDSHKPKAAASKPKKSKKATAASDDDNDSEAAAKEAEFKYKIAITPEQEAKITPWIAKVIENLAEEDKTTKKRVFQFLASLKFVNRRDTKENRYLWGISFSEPNAAEIFCSNNFRNPGSSYTRIMTAAECLHCMHVMRPDKNKDERLVCVALDVAKEDKMEDTHTLLGAAFAERLTRAISKKFGNVNPIASTDHEKFSATQLIASESTKVRAAISEILNKLPASRFQRLAVKFAKTVAAEFVTLEDGKVGIFYCDQGTIRTLGASVSAYKQLMTILGRPFKLTYLTQDDGTWFTSFCLGKDAEDTSEPARRMGAAFLQCFANLEPKQFKKISYTLPKQKPVPLPDEHATLITLAETLKTDALKANTATTNIQKKIVQLKKFGLVVAQAPDGEWGYPCSSPEDMKKIASAFSFVTKGNKKQYAVIQDAFKVAKKTLSLEEATKNKVSQYWITIKLTQDKDTALSDEIATLRGIFVQQQLFMSCNPTHIKNNIFVKSPNNVNVKGSESKDPVARAAASGKRVVLKVSTEPRFAAAAAVVSATTAMHSGSASQPPAADKDKAIAARGLSSPARAAAMLAAAPVPAAAAASGMTHSASPVAAVGGPVRLAPAAAVGGPVRLAPAAVGGSVRLAPAAAARGAFPLASAAGATNGTTVTPAARSGSAPEKR